MVAHTSISVNWISEPLLPFARNTTYLMAQICGTIWARLNCVKPIWLFPVLVTTSPPLTRPSETSVFVVSITQAPMASLNTLCSPLVSRQCGKLKVCCLSYMASLASMEYSSHWKLNCWTWAHFYSQHIHSTCTHVRHHWDNLVCLKHINVFRSTSGLAVHNISQMHYHHIDTSPLTLDHLVLAFQTRQPTMNTKFDSFVLNELSLTWLSGSSIC